MIDYSLEILNYKKKTSRLFRRKAKRKIIAMNEAPQAYELVPLTLMERLDSTPLSACERCRGLRLIELGAWLTDFLAALARGGRTRKCAREGTRHA
jgi:hypothetical protein